MLMPNSPAAQVGLAVGARAGVHTPVVIVSSRTDEIGIVKALETGADDYVTKPFGMNELGARIGVALRHRLQQQGERAIFQTGGLTMDLVKRIVKVDGTVRRYTFARGILTIRNVTAGKHAMTVAASDYQEAKNMENVGPILPNTRTFSKSVVVR